MVTAAERELESAVEKEAACKKAVDECSVEVEDATKAEKEASRALSQFEPEMKQVAKDAAKARENLASMKSSSGALGAFAELSELTFVVPDTQPVPQEHASAGTVVEQSA